jgi:hypothetical protein
MLLIYKSRQNSLGLEYFTPRKDGILCTNTSQGVIRGEDMTPMLINAALAALLCFVF